MPWVWVPWVLHSKSSAVVAFHPFTNAFSPPYPHKESAPQRCRAHSAEQMNTGITHHCCRQSQVNGVSGFDLAQTTRVHS